jgi:hypothetical protein
MPGQGLSLFVIGSAWDSCSRPPIAAVVAPPHSAASDPKNTRTTRLAPITRLEGLGSWAMPAS